MSAVLTRLDERSMTVSSETIAAACGVRHQGTLSLIARHRAHLEEFGALPETTEMRSPGSYPSRIIHLNRYQAMLLMLNMRGTHFSRDAIALVLSGLQVAAGKPAESLPRLANYGPGHGGFVYVAGFSDGVVKIGQTRSVRARRYAYEREARARNAEVTYFWLSPECANYSKREQDLRKFCVNRYPSFKGREYFKGDYRPVAEFAQTLTYQTPDGQNGLKVLAAQNEMFRALFLADKLEAEVMGE